MKRLFTLFILSCLIFLGTAGLHPVSAADVRSGEEVTIPSTATNLNDLYLFGGKVFVDAPVTNDVVAAGGDVTISKPVSGSVIIAGGNLKVSGDVGGTIRAAGGKVRIDAPITRDLVVAGGDITVTQNAVINGDAIINGGKVNLEGPVKGDVQLNGGEATINASVSGSVAGTVGKLTLGPNAVINGNLTYKSQEKATIADGAVIKGKTNFTEIKQPDTHAAKEILAAGTFYKLLTDIILSVLVIFFFTRAILAVFGRMAESPVQSGAIGLAFLIFFPIAAAILLILLLLGVVAFFAYGVIIFVSLLLVKIFLGWYVIHWWENREKKDYRLDWKAGVIGPILLYVLGLIPIIGWLAVAILMLVTTGAVVQELWDLIARNRLAPAKSVSRKK